MRRRSDGLLLAAAGLHGSLLVAWPSAPLVALGLWWNSNTVAHNFIHNPFFRSRRWNACFSALNSLLLGYPQTLWRERHLAHHADRPARFRFSKVEGALVALLWAALALLAPRFFLFVYVPGYAAGMVLCALQGHFEHAAGRPVDHHGALYNLLFFNDGYHTEHHRRPGRHWTRLGERSGARASRWPAVLRWLDAHPLDLLERVVLRAPRLQRWVLAVHRRALRRVLPPARNVLVVGGGLFPRTAILLRELLPDAAVTVVDRDAGHLAAAGLDVPTLHAEYDPAVHTGYDLVVIPLAYRGDRAALYARPPAPLLVHDWMWRRRGRSAPVSWLLAKRVNVVGA